MFPLYDKYALSDINDNARMIRWNKFTFRNYNSPCDTYIIININVFALRSAYLSRLWPLIIYKKMANINGGINTTDESLFCESELEPRLGKHRLMVVLFLLLFITVIIIFLFFTWLKQDWIVNNEDYHYYVLFHVYVCSNRRYLSTIILLRHLFTKKGTGTHLNHP